MARTVLMTNVLREFYSTSTPIPGATPLARGEFVYSPLGSASMVFRRQIAPFQRYKVRARIFGWTEKWLFVLCVFKSTKGTHAFGLSKYVFKHRKMTIKPVDALKAAGVWTEECEIENAQVQRYLNDSLDVETIEKFI